MRSCCLAFQPTCHHVTVLEAKKKNRHVVSTLYDLGRSGKQSVTSPLSAGL